MFISLGEILGDKCKDVIENSYDNIPDGIETQDPKLEGAHVIVFIQAGRTLFRVVPGFFTDITNSKIVLNDPRRTFIQNSTNIIEVGNNIHEINGYKFTMATINTPEEWSITGHKYYHRANWLS